MFHLPHVFWCVLIFSLSGHVSRICGLVGVAVDSPVYEPLVDVMDASGLTSIKSGSLDLMVVRGSVVRAVDCRSAGPWFNSGWRSVYVMTWSSNQIIQMINIMSPITTSIRTITRNSAMKMEENERK